MSAKTCFLYLPEQGLKEVNEIPNLSAIDAKAVVWLDLELSDTQQMSEIAEKFGLHELAVEDALTENHLPKLDVFSKYLFIICSTLNQSNVEKLADQGFYDSKDNEELSITSSLSIFLGDNFIITHRTQEIPWLDALKRQIKQVPENTIAKGSDELAHKVIDVLIDRFARGLNYYELKIDALEDQVLDSDSDFSLSDTLNLKRDLNSLRQIMRIQRVVLSRLSTETALIEERQLRRYFKDIDDHAIAILKSIDELIDNLVNIRDTSFALSNVRLGDIMRILAVITTITAPLNLLVGFYGMNFDAIPLLHNQYGFLMVTGVMVMLAVVMLIFFRRNKWL